MKVVKTGPIDELFMRRCLELAESGLGYVSPNPMVGAVIVHEGNAIGEGYHRQFGMAHAEVNAINSVKDPLLLKESTLYVNLEPCVHTGKTPPCTDMILEKKIPSVVIGTPDPNQLVNGRGIERLIKHGVNVKTGILEKECQSLNKRFFTFHKAKRPYIILKWAQTGDGFIDIIREPDEPIGVNWISNPLSRSLVHKWRSSEMGVMVGTNTIIHDNPALSVRYWNGRNPIRIIPDRTLRVPDNYKIRDNTQNTLIFNTKRNDREGLTEFVKLDGSDWSIISIFEQLYHREILSVFVEGGRALLNYLIGNDLWDEARVFIGDKLFTTGIKAPEIECLPAFQKSVLTDKILVYKNPKNDYLQ